MRYLLLISHGGLATGLKSSLSMFAGDKMEQVLAFGLKEGQSVDDFSLEVKEGLQTLTDDDTVVVLADIVGGSPLTTTCSVLEELGKLSNTTVLGGMNLTMALTAVVMKDLLEGNALVESVLSESQAALQEFEITSADEEDDDDI